MPNKDQKHHLIGYHEVQAFLSARRNCLAQRYQDYHAAFITFFRRAEILHLFSLFFILFGIVCFLL